MENIIQQFCSEWFQLKFICVCFFFSRRRDKQYSLVNTLRSSIGGSQLCPTYACELSVSQWLMLLHVLPVKLDCSKFVFVPVFVDFHLRLLVLRMSR